MFEMPEDEASQVGAPLVVLKASLDLPLFADVLDAQVYQMRAMKREPDQNVVVSAAIEMERQFC